MDKLKKFMNIWEIEANFKCPVVGAMLSVEKHKSILKKCGWDVSRLKAYEYHSSLMGCLGDENAVSLKVNNYIRHQARKIMEKVAVLYEREPLDAAGQKVRSLWTAWAAEGKIGPAMYALVSHRDTDIELLRDIQGEVHMLAHANMTEVFDIRKKVSAVHETLAREKGRVSEKSGRIRELVTETKAQARDLQRLGDENARLRQEIAALEARLDSGLDPESGPVRDYEDRIGALEEAFAGERQRAVTAEKAEKQLQIELFSARNENKMIRDEINVLVSAFSLPRAPESCPALAASQAAGFAGEPINCTGEGACDNDTCPNYTLCARRVFMIGGITKMKSYYREIVEKAGGVFDYHDGYMKNANANLAAKVRRCDVVVCPVSCNSHTACLKVKKLCQQYNKELKILNSASLSAVTQALFVPETGQLN